MVQFRVNVGCDMDNLLVASPQLTRHFTLAADTGGLSVLTCQSCNNTFTSVPTITKHCCDYKCINCGEMEKSVEAILQHYINCKTNKPQILALYSCSCCTLKFKSNSELQQHTKEHIHECLKQYANLLKERGLAETPTGDPQPPLKRGRRRKMNDCTLCGLVYKSKEDYQHHMKRVHYSTLPHACRLCEERFLHLQELEMHIVQHFLGAYKCDFCGINFGLKYPFLKHLEANHTGDFLLKCEFCPYTTNHYHNYRSHRKQPHEAKEGINLSSFCQQCQELIPEDEMEEHLSEHRECVPVTAKKLAMKTLKNKGRTLKKKNQYCSECNIVFPSPAALSRHNHKHHPQKYSHECDTCGHRFKGTRALELHQEGHKNGTCWCPLCKLRFSQRSHVARHFSIAHSDNEKIPCEYCTDQLNSYSKYVYHCHTSHADLLEDRLALKCNDCGISVSSRLLLKKHMATKHGVNRQNAPKTECPVCKKFFVHIDAHMNLHTRAVQFPCNECGEVFFLRSSLNVHHKQRHDLSAKKYICQTCSKAFISSSLLQAHQEQVHMNIRQFFCEFCGRAYKNKSALTYHLKVHSGDRPYKCPQCGLGFHRPSILKTHMESAHHLPYTYMYRKPHRKAGTGMPSNISRRTQQSDQTSLVKIYVADEITDDDLEVDIGKDLPNVEGGLVRSDNEACMSVNMNSSEIITIVDDLHTLPTLCGDEGMYIVHTLDDN